MNLLAAFFLGMTAAFTIFIRLEINRMRRKLMNQPTAGEPITGPPQFFVHDMKALDEWRKNQ